jgi:hypothetical protein
MSTAAPAAKVRKTENESIFEVLLDGEVVATLTKTFRNVAKKQGRTYTGYQMKTAWQIHITAPGVSLMNTFETVLTPRKDAVDLIVRRVLAAR